MTKRIFIILMLFASCKSTKDIGQIGKWTGEYGIMINSVINTGNNLNDTLHEKFEELIESPIDTSYFIVPRILNFLPNGVFYIDGGDKITKGKWYVENEIVILDLDSVKLFGKPTNKNLTLQSNDDTTKTVLYFRKQNNRNATTKTKNDFIGEFWEIKQKDSLIATYHFIDSASVLINYESGLNRGLWDCHQQNDIFLLSIFDLEFLKLTTIYIEDFNSGLSRTIQERDNMIPRSYSTIAKQGLLLTAIQQNELKSKLLGDWESSDFYPEEDAIKEHLTDLKFELVLNDTVFSIDYSGINNKSQKRINKNIHGSWSLSETGQYIILNYKKMSKNKVYETVNYLPVKLVGSNVLIIEFSIESLTNEILGFGKREINLEKK